MSARNQDLAQLARSAAAQSAGVGRKAWTLAEIALRQSGTPELAEAVIEDLAANTGLAALAAACLRSLLAESKPASTEPQLTGGSQP